MKRVLVTGGKGYIGSILCEHLHKAGYEVSVLDQPGDIRDKKLVKQFIKGVDVIIPLAAIVGTTACTKNPVLAREVNIDSIRMLNELRTPKQWIIYISTEMTFDSKSLYARTKAIAESYLNGNPNTVIIRLASVFGVSPAMKLDLLLNRFVHEAVTKRVLTVYNKHVKRNYIHVRDVADHLVHCIKNLTVSCSYNLGGTSFSKEELALKIKEHVKNLKLYFSDSDRVEKQSYKEIQFQANRTVDDGIKELIREFSNDKSRIGTDQ